MQMDYCATFFKVKIKKKNDGNKLNFHMKNVAQKFIYNMDF